MQYARRAFREPFKAHDIAGSMSRKGGCRDNPVVESFFGTLKPGRFLWRSCQTREKARGDIVEYITMLSNSRRLHSYLDYQSLDEFGRNSQPANTDQQGV